MIYPYREVRTLPRNKLISLCNAHGWYKGGTEKNFNQLCTRAEELAPLSSDGIVELAQDIMWYSWLNVEDIPFIAVELANNCNHYFLNIQDLSANIPYE